MPNEEVNARLRAYRARTGNAATKKYEKTPKGKIMRSYRNMQSRVEGVQVKKHHLYHGKTLLSREEFYEWSMFDPDFCTLYVAWQESGYDRKLSPSVDRIDSTKGYVLGNIRWLTHSENSRLGSLSQACQRRLAQNGV